MTMVSMAVSCDLRQLCALGILLALSLAKCRSAKFICVTKVNDLPLSLKVYRYEMIGHF